MNRWWLWAVGGVGVVILGMAGWKTFFSPDPGAALIVVVITGALLLISPFLLPHLEALMISADGFELRLVRQMARHGAPETARLLNNTELAEIAEAYGVIHTQLVGGTFYTVRKQVQDHLVTRAAAFASQRTFNPDEIKALFPTASGPVRVLLLGLMQGDPRLVDAATLTEAITVPVTANEQYQALVLAETNLRRFTEAERATLLAAVASADLGNDDSDRRKIVDRIKAAE
ncbi:hypothetical protein Q0Z83_030550 [Actinoplanes sichuanensis]|uniref:Uncharacterized protein n=1 Tax=Actinoplanes sichuanensis TaxID=512349 RepID=A0ABW4AQJ0_9ACTN|nr:hypothetical protein [Actinoplanes sichuanensis]BEL04864.1 hypothetical protein Q0Z83_030550 [Actinoplanes sichuanensis]